MDRQMAACREIRDERAVLVDDRQGQTETVKSDPDWATASGTYAEYQKAVDHTKAVPPELLTDLLELLDRPGLRAPVPICRPRIYIPELKAGTVEEAVTLMC